MVNERLQLGHIAGVPRNHNMARNLLCCPQETLGMPSLVQVLPFNERLTVKCALHRNSLWVDFNSIFTNG